MPDGYLWLDKNRSMRRTLICADFVVTPETTEGPRAHKAQISLTIRADWHIAVRDPPCFRHDLSILNHVRRSRLLRDNRSLHAARWNNLTTINALDRASPFQPIAPSAFEVEAWSQAPARNWLVPWHQPSARRVAVRRPDRHTRTAPSEGSSAGSSTPGDWSRRICWARITSTPTCCGSQLKGGSTFVSGARAQSGRGRSSTHVFVLGVSERVRWPVH
jgi:hypothetical protein